MIKYLTMNVLMSIDVKTPLDKLNDTCGIAAARAAAICAGPVRVS